MQNDEPPEPRGDVPPAEPATVLGLFLGLFSLLVLLAIAFTPTLKGRVTNAACGAILLAIAVALLWVGRRRS